MFGQLGHFTKFAPEKVPYAINRYTTGGPLLMILQDKYCSERVSYAWPYCLTGSTWVVPVAEQLPPHVAGRSL